MRVLGLLQELFLYQDYFNDDIGDWDVSKVTNFQVRSMGLGSRVP